MLQSSSPKTLLALSLPLALLSFCSIASSQSGGRFEDAKRMARQYIESNQFDKAAAKLEEVWEQDKTDPTVAENLGIAYLNGDDRRYNPAVVDKAVKIMEESLQAGGRATFLIQHMHEGKAIIIVTGGNSLKYCNGRLSISKGKLFFVMKPIAGAEDHSFETAAADIKIIPPKSPGEFKISRRVDSKWQNYTVQPRNGVKTDTNLMLNIIHEQLGI
jgi:hypothetical protein